MISRSALGPLAVVWVLVPAKLLAQTPPGAPAPASQPSVTSVAPAPAPAPMPQPVAPEQVSEPEVAATATTTTTTLTTTTETTTVTEAPAEEEPPAKVGYEKGFFIESGDGDYKLAIGARLQARYTYVAVEAGDDASFFEIARARIKLEGHAFTPDLTYVFQPDFGKGFVTLKDFYADYRIAPEWLHVRAGQWKRPFSRQQITSSGSQALVDRAITDRAFGAGRDIGFALHNNYEKSPGFEYAIGLYNGTGERPLLSGDVAVDPTTGEGEIASGSFSNVPSLFNPALVGRVGVNSKDLKGYSEVDFEGGPFRGGVGASGQVDFDADDDNDSLVRAELDYIVKLHGFDSTGGVYVSSVQDATGFGDRTLGAIGVHVQAGYLIAQKYQPAVRYSLVAPKGPDNNTQEIALALNYFPFKHNVKWQTDVAAIAMESATTDVQVRTQLQLAF